MASPLVRKRRKEKKPLWSQKILECFDNFLWLPKTRKKCFSSLNTYDTCVGLHTLAPNHLLSFYLSFTYLRDIWHTQNSVLSKELSIHFSSVWKSHPSTFTSVPTWLFCLTYMASVTTWNYLFYLHNKWNMNVIFLENHLFIFCSLFYPKHLE